MYKVKIFDVAFYTNEENNIEEQIKQMAELLVMSTYLHNPPQNLSDEVGDYDYCEGEIEEDE